MARYEPLRGEPLPLTSCLEDYRDAVERLRGETVAELGPQPMAPETASMLAVAVASLPIIAAMLPITPIDLQVWQIGLVLAGVWAGAFQLQRLRYDRFDRAWQRKVAAHQALEGAALAPQLLRRHVTGAGQGRRSATRRP